MIAAYVEPLHNLLREDGEEGVSDGGEHAWSDSKVKYVPTIEDERRHVAKPRTYLVFHHVPSVQIGPR